MKKRRRKLLVLYALTASKFPKVLKVPRDFAFLEAIAVAVVTVGLELTTKGDLHTFDTDDAALPVGTDGLVLMADDAESTGLKYAKALDFIVVADEKTSGTNGGTSTSGAWRTRDLNTERIDTGGHASLAANQITLAAGTYVGFISSPFYRSANCQARLQDVDNTVTLILGSNATNGTTGAAFANSVGYGGFTLAAETTLELQYQVGTSRGTDGLGAAGSFGTESYGIVGLVRLGE